MIEEFAYNFIFNIKNVFDNANTGKYFYENVGGIARKAKRFIVYVMSEGLVKALMFAYSKAKTENIQNFEEVTKNVAHKEVEWSETYDWIVVSKFTIDFIRENFGKILGNLSTDPEDFIGTLIANKDRLLYVEEITIKALNILSMLCFALERR